MKAIFTEIADHKNEIIESFIKAWVAVNLKPGEREPAVRSILENMQLCTKLEGTTQKYWLEFKSDDKEIK